MSETKIRRYFVAAETVLFLIFVFLDLKHYDSSFFKYSGILLCLIYSVLIRNKEGSLAFLFTLIADYFLLIRNDHHLCGVLVFVAVQLIYGYILFRKGCRPFYVLRTVLLFLLLAVLFLLRQFSPLNLLALVYFSLLLGNFLSSLTEKKLRFMSAGFLLFLCCDICVGLFNLLDHGPVYAVASVLMWVFYLPSQVLLAIGQKDH